MWTAKTTIDTTRRFKIIQRVAFVYDKMVQLKFEEYKYYYCKLFCYRISVRLLLSIYEMKQKLVLLARSVCAIRKFRSGRLAGLIYPLYTYVHSAAVQVF